ncbi:MAG: class I SAM-dependent methyltransferase, partial [Desulfobacteraceae bacterium]|nr:class I SAM-dependent methyltransferase [Desulfobacteraceae bacterium]
MQGIYHAVIKGTSHKVAEKFDKKVDFLFIDGDHSYEGVK